jgi:uncharacterized protein (TIGR03435 family)
MTRTKTQTAIVAATGALLLIGATGMTGCKKATVEVTPQTPQTQAADQSTSPPEDDSWLTQDLTPAILEQCSPQVRILPTKFSSMRTCGSIDLAKWGGIDVPISLIFRVAYQWSPGRIVFSAPEPSGGYDFIANLPQGACEALQRELQKQFGLAGRTETRDADALILKVRTPNARGLKPPVIGGHSDFNRNGEYVCDDRPLSTDTQPFVGLQRFLEKYFRVPVVDETGLTNHYSIDLKWNERGQDDPNHEALKTALANQLGLELVPGHRSIEMLVVEKAN